MLGFTFDDFGTPANSDNVTASDDGARDLCVGTFIGTLASKGQIRAAIGGVDGNGFEFYAKRGLDAGDFLVLGAYNETLEGAPRDVVTLGGYGLAADAPYLLTAFANGEFSIALTTPTPESQISGFTLTEYETDGPIVGFKRRALVLDRHTNLIFTGGVASAGAPEDFLGMGEGVQGWGYAEQNPTESPVGAITPYVDEADGEAYYRKADGDTRMMFGGGATLPFTFAADADQALTPEQSTEHDALIIRPGVLTAARTLTWSTPPLPSKRLFVRNQNAEGVTLTFSSGGGVFIHGGGWAIITGDGSDAVPLADG